MLIKIRIARVLRLCAAISVMALGTTGCGVKVYVDGGPQKVSLAQIRKPERRTDVQLIFQFHTKGTPNAWVTDSLKGEVQGLIASSELFTTVGTEPSSSGAILSVTVDSVSITDQRDADAQGFGNLLPFKQSMSSTTDGYVCTLQYYTPAAASTLTTTSRRAILVTVEREPPPNSIEAVNPEHAVSVMMRQIIIDGLKQLSANPVFASSEST